jgi:ABC-type sugar transport system ATPase subunit
LVGCPAGQTEERERRKVLDDPGAGSQRVGLLAGMTDAEAAIADAGSASAPLVRVSGVGKAFGETQALRDASFELLPGEVHAIVGENGSGKSTLVKILTGVHAPDAGEIEIAGASARALGSPRAARELGIATVFQEVLVAEARSVLDNVWLGHEGLLRTRVGAREKRARARDLLGELLDRELDLDGAAEELSLSDRQACCIVRALLHRPRVLMLDEATSALDVATRDRLFAIARRLSGEGVGIVFITHRMDEILEIGDRITVMRSGETVATLQRGQWTPDEVVELMTGTGRLTGHARERARAVDERRGEPVLSARGVRLRAGREPIDVEIHAGELVGVAGLEGHGQSEFLDALRGARTVEGDVVRHRDGRTIAIDSATGAARNGIAYVPRERRQALFGWMSIRENFGLPTLIQDARGGWLSNASTRRRLAQYVRRLGIVLGQDGDRITTLSGGNQQKVVIARWLAAGPRILLLNDPTRGVDFGAKRDLYALLAELARDGVAVVMLSSELDEHVELMDRVLVFREHQLQRVIVRDDLTRLALVSAFFGEGEDRSVL